MKNQGSDFIIHGLFVDDVMRLRTRDKLRDDFFPPYERDLEITGGANIPEHGSQTTRQMIRLQYTLIHTFRKSWLSTKSTSRKHFAQSVFAPGIVLNHEDCATVPDDGLIGASRSTTNYS